MAIDPTGSLLSVENSDSPSHRTAFRIQASRLLSKADLVWENPEMG